MFHAQPSYSLRINHYSFILCVFARGFFGLCEGDTVQKFAHANFVILSIFLSPQFDNQA